MGYTKAGHMIWHVYQLAGLVGNKTSSDPRFIAGNYGGEQASIAAGSSAGGNWLYGGSNNQVVLQATQLQDFDERRLQPGVRHRRNVADPPELDRRHAAAGCRAQPATVMRCNSRRSPL